jgi:hypothetical protein
VIEAIMAVKTGSLQTRLALIVLESEKQIALLRIKAYQIKEDVMPYSIASAIAAK